jgi:hypothetical protein
VLIDYQCRQPVFFRARHFVLQAKSKRRRKMAPVARSASETDVALRRHSAVVPILRHEEAAAMSKKRIKPNYRRRLLRLPDLDHCKRAVLNSLGSPASRRVYEFAIDQFIAWYCSEPRLALTASWSSARPQSGRSPQRRQTKLLSARSEPWAVSGVAYPSRRKWRCRSREPNPPWGIRRRQPKGCPYGRGGRSRSWAHR